MAPGKPAPRAGVWPGRAGQLVGADGVKSGSRVPGRATPGTVTLNVTAPRTPPSPFPLRQVAFPAPKLQLLGALAADLTLGLFFGVSRAAPFPGALAWSKASALWSLLRDSGKQKGLAFVS